MRDTKEFGRRLTVAHFMPWSGIGGVEIATLRLITATRDRFHHVAFFLPDAIDLIKLFEEAGVQTITYTPPTPSLRRAGTYYRASLTVARQIRRVEADIVHFAEEKAAYHNSLGAFLAQCKVVCHLRVSNPKLDLRQKLCLLPVHSFIFVSKEAMQTFDVPLSKRRATVIYDAIEVPSIDTSESNAAVRRELGIADGCVVVGTIARVSPQKDYFTLAAAASKILAKYPQTKFLVVGDNSMVELNRHHYSEVAKSLKEMGISDSFIFTGHRSDVSRLIAAMDICVLCTHREGFPLCILEAMAMRKPVVATAVGGIPEIVDPGVTGYLHSHCNEHELTAAVTALIEDPEKAKKMGSTAFEHVRMNYSPQKFADEVAMAYYDVM